MKAEIFDITEHFCELLTEHNIKYEIKPIWDGYQWTFPEYEQGDVICCSGSYGLDLGHVESKGFPWDKDDVSHCYPEAMAERIAKVINKKETNAVKKIFVLFDTITGYRLYFDSESARQDYCTKIVTVAVSTGVPVAHLPTFGDDFNYNTFVLYDEEINPTFDTTAWTEYWKD